MTTNPPTEPTTEKIEQCGFCGRFFRGNTYLTDLKPSGDIPLGYCPEAQAEDYQQNPEKYHWIVTKDMAIDAGMPELEGSIL